MFILSNLIMKNVVLIAFMLCTVAGFGLRMLGPADAIFLSIEDCDDVETLDWYTFTIDQKKFNRTTYIWDVLLDNKYPLNDSLILEVNVSLKKEGGYKEGAFFYKKPFCEALDTLIGDVFKMFLSKTLGKESCPIPAGAHRIEDFYFDNEKFTVPHLYGEYRTVTITYMDDVMVKCLKSYFELVPKDKE